MNNTYSITKNAVERFVDMYVRFRDARFTVVRALNAYGPRQVAAAPYGPSRVRKVMPSFCCRALDGQPIQIYGDGDQIMDMIFVTDVAKVLVKALIHTAESGPIKTPIEAGTGRRTTVNQIANLVVKEVNTLVGSDIASVEHLPMRPGEDENSVVLADATTLAYVGMDPDELVTLEDGVQRTVAHFKAYLDRR